MSSELTLDEFDGSNCVDRVVSFGGNAAVAGKIGIDRSETELAASACELWQRLHCIYCDISPKNRFRRKFGC